MLKRICPARIGLLPAIALFALLAPGAGSGALAQEVRFTTPATPWETEGFGNHRAVVRVNAPATAVQAVVPWRRRDRDPAARLVIVTDETGKRIVNVGCGRIDREMGEIRFEPKAGTGRYFIYYLPYRTTGRTNYPKVVYPPPELTADAAWLAKAAAGTSLPQAMVEEIQSVDEFNSFFPMEIIATAEETRSLVVAQPGAAFLVFPEDRLQPIRMPRDLPHRWLRTGVTRRFAGEARRGEYFAFQLGVYAIAKLEDLRVSFSDLQSVSGLVIAARQIHSINTEGVNWDGRPLAKTLDVPAGSVQPLWCGIDIPAAAVPGSYRGTVTVSARGKSPFEIQLEMTVTDSLVADGGANEPEKQTRLKWLDSTLAQGNEVIAPYTPLKVAGQTVEMLGRSVTLGKLGLPAGIRTYFPPEMTSLTERPQAVLAGPMELIIELPDRRPVAWAGGEPRFIERSPGKLSWEAAATSPELEAQLRGTIEFDGFVFCSLTVTAKRQVDLRDIHLLIPYARAAAVYMMGLGLKGGYRPAEYDWKWDVATKNQDGAWLGGVNAGMFFSLRGENYARPLNTNFYLHKPLNLPASWGNAGQGGIRLHERGDTVEVDCYSGARTMSAGEAQQFNFNLIITPFHPLDTDFQWRTRFYHRYDQVDAVKATGATVVNIHHATPINPWINYPFITHREMQAYVEEAHRQGLKVKIYNTVRELSNRAYELYALRSLGHEIFTPGEGGGFSWLQEHLGDDYIAAWFVPRLQDAAVINSGMSRWHNYYVEGMNWLVRQVGIDGIYLDDVAFDRTTMKRIKRVLTQDGHPGIVDLHSANQFNQQDGFVNSAVLYLEHFPYLNRLWFGEYFDYEKNPPEFFLTEISGIPFGLMGEMLQDGGNAWRGMVYGMTNRMPWNEKSDPRPIWRAWDEFGMEGTRMIGYWVPGNPVQTGRSDVLATVYSKPGAALVALASWADSDTSIRLSVDWKVLGLDPVRVTIEAPEVSNFQPSGRFVADGPIPVQKGKGWMLILKESR